MAAKLNKAQAELAKAKAAVVAGQKALDAKKRLAGDIVRDQYQQQTNLLPIAMLLESTSTSDLQTRLQWSTTMFDTTAGAIDRLKALQVRAGGREGPAGRAGGPDRRRPPRGGGQPRDEEDAARPRPRRRRRTSPPGPAAGGRPGLGRRRRGRGPGAVRPARPRSARRSSSGSPPGSPRPRPRPPPKAAEQRARQAAARKAADRAAAEARRAKEESRKAQQDKASSRGSSSKGSSSGGSSSGGSSAGGSSTGGSSSGGSSSGGSSSSGSSSAHHGFSYPVVGAHHLAVRHALPPGAALWKLHDGTDFGAGCGTAIRAPYSGRVAERYYNAGYGNRLMIDHGMVDGRYVTTGYNHAIRYTVRWASTSARAR